jgi:hypothetical protein
MGFPVENGHHGIISHGNPIKNSHGFPGRKWTPWDYFPWEIFPPWDYFPWESHKKFPWVSR